MSDERRIVTILFADVAGSTAMGEALDPEQLQLAARRAFAEARPQLISIIAPAGAGKSRLVEEFLAALPASTGTPLVAIAQCLPYGQRLTFWPLRAVLHRFVGIADDAPVEGLRARVSAWLAARGVAEPEWTGELLASTVGAAATAQPDRVAMFDAWRSAVQAAGATGPVVIVFEDLHWSSDTLLDLVEHVMQPRAQLPIETIAAVDPKRTETMSFAAGPKQTFTRGLSTGSGGRRLLSVARWCPLGSSGAVFVHARGTGACVPAWPRPSVA